MFPFDGDFYNFTNGEKNCVWLSCSEEKMSNLASFSHYIYIYI